MLEAVYSRHCCSKLLAQRWRLELNAPGDLLINGVDLSLRSEHCSAIDDGRCQNLFKNRHLICSGQSQLLPPDNLLQIILLDVESG